MNPQTESIKAKPPAPVPADEFKPQTRLAVVYFDRSVMFGSEMESASVPSANDIKRGNRGSNSVDSITLAWLNADGSVSDAGAGAADGLALRTAKHDLNTGKKRIMQSFVPWSNVRSVSYGE